MLAEAAYALPSSVGFFYRIPDNLVVAVEITQHLRGAVTSAIAQIREVDEKQWFPPATKVRQRCVECEYANYCADVW